MFFEQMHPSWQDALLSKKPLLDSIESKVLNLGTDVVPPLNQVMRAFELPLEEVRVLIVGQDPYPTPGHANGLSFAVSAESKPLPRSLSNIVRELSDDLGRLNSDGSTRAGDLTKWANQGVLLLNRHLTAVSSEAGSMMDIGWAEFTDEVIQVLNRKRGRRLVSILWGAQAQSLAPKLCDSQVLMSAHPSPLSARKGFFGSKPFSKANAALELVGEQPIDWSC
jgi:uracil-DNA glycosylase